MTGKNKGQVLPFTLSEVFTLLFFALALVLVYESLRLQELEKKVADNQEAAEAIEPLGLEDARTLIEMVAEASDSIPNDFTELVRTIRRESEARRELEERLLKVVQDSIWVDTTPGRRLLDSLQTETENRRRVEEAIKEMVGDSTWLDSASATALIDTLLASRERMEIAAERLAQELGLGESERDLVDRMAGDVSQAEREASDLRGQIENLIGQLGNGLDHPPCWPDAAGRPEYAYEVEIMNDLVSVRQVWPPHRAAQAAEIPGMLALPGANLSYDEFIRRSIPVFNWSARRDPECRHFVRIVDRVDGGKEPYKEALLTVERFFYKFLVN